MSNRDYVQAMQDLRRSNASAPIPSRKPLRRGGRDGAKRAAIKEGRNG